MRTITVEDTTLDRCKKYALSQGLLKPYEITESPTRMPTERQLEYAKDLGINIPEQATFYEVSDLISRACDGDSSDPNPGLIEFANAREIPFSKYIGKKALYNLVFNKLSGEEKIAFFIFCVYRWLSDDRYGNLDTFVYKAKIYEIARTVSEDEQFIKSMNKYNGQDIRFFGEFTAPDGYTYSGGSTNTIAYKTTAKILNERFGLKNKTVKVMLRNKELQNEVFDLKNKSDKIMPQLEIKKSINKSSKFEIFAKRFFIASVIFFVFVCVIVWIAS